MRMRRRDMAVIGIRCVIRVTRRGVVIGERV